MQQVYKNRTFKGYQIKDVLYLDQNKEFLETLPYYLNTEAYLSRNRWDCPYARKAIITFVQKLIRNIIRKEEARFGIIIPKLVEGQLIQFSMAIPSSYELIAIPEWIFMIKS